MLAAALCCLRCRVVAATLYHFYSRTACCNSPGLPERYSTCHCAHDGFSPLVWQLGHVVHCRTCIQFAWSARFEREYVRCISCIYLWLCRTPAPGACGIAIGKK